ncbi:MAG TPA: trypsin-like peptidase domain-containing protein [Flavobacterium sp.]|uniref:trypsin-like peptidase domain-containing protein n=1 Tax=Flavobacterium sp. TaxID=239 RepID=UPI002DB82FB7|nr:trypsin-like peptidase domain-containing protein [Flavobacterium sp.]HEU4790793.1 trypsin-like peptidase domain-containing protein [Flavobacterium sp.]
MTTFRKINLYSQAIFLFCFFFLMQGCHAQDKNNGKSIEDIQNSASKTAPKVSYTGNVDFKMAAKIATPGVVNIKCTLKRERQPFENGNRNDFYDLPELFKDFFKNDPYFKQYKLQPDQNPEPIIGSASGVILTPDGYIVTNNHVVNDVDKIEVTLYDGRSYPARIIGTDPQTDLALIKIDAQNLSFIMFGDSDVIEVGEWVVAVGNPFNLASTVTAGIVSAKARNINILSNQGAIESFIQTDAAVNPGNSGGALVTLEGKLIGINTAIATPTGVYAGYAFAIPVDIVKKVTNDLMNFGAVQRGVLGIGIRDMDSTIAKELNIERANGVYVDSVSVTGAAKEAGVKTKDVIIKIDDIETNTSSKLLEIIMRKRPGDKVAITLIRDGKEQKKLIATLKKQEVITPVETPKNVDLLKNLGVTLVEINKEDQKRYNLKAGLKITKIDEGKLKQFTDIREGFVITSVNNRPVSTIKSFMDAVESKSRGIMLEGKYANNPTYYYYAFGL